MMMAMLRLNVPSIFVYGGSILPGRFHGKDVTVKDVFEVVGRYAAGTCPLSRVHELERVACPGHGACGANIPPIPWRASVRRSDYHYRTAIWSLLLILRANKSQPRRARR